MALYVDGVLLKDPANSPDTMKEFYATYKDALEPAAITLTATKLHQVSTGDVTLYVDQHEYAVICADSSCVFSKLGSDMATTCHIVVLHHKDTNVAALGHFNGPRKVEMVDAVTKQGINDMINQMLEEIFLRLKAKRVPRIDLDLQIVGGFCDKNGLSDLLSVHLLRDFFHYKPASGSPSVRFNLTMFCASKWNNIKKIYDGAEINCWDIGGVVCDAATGELTPAQFDDDARTPVIDARTPVIDARGARWLTNVLHYPNIYRIQDNRFILKPYSYNKHIHDIPGLLKLTCQELKNKLSTSPDVEASGYCHYTRAGLKFIEDNPNPLESVFANGKPITRRAEIVDGRLEWHQD